ncbi:hypothetical protein OIK40_01210 [Erythrobacter sp. sf7]|uniref:Uncharacterized protein n=1 Tax=Erythrobacter fulvus TaxID=2987523 RepID=A0ABT5JLL6_9SPHN|nr:hypothetical protein [Erythrobacter fulvus]MDC8753255.1 hypothetical protein [Erythrobacter fulvus]
MQMSERSRKALRYRAYFWLMDASLVAVAYAAIEPIISYFFDYDISTVLPEPVRAVFLAFVTFFILVVPVILICAKFMRDEYCEQLWKRSFVVMAYLTALAPLIYMVVYWSLFYALGQPKPLPPILAWPFREVTMGPAIYIAWIGYMMVFVALFQFLRWRDAR